MTPFESDAERASELLAQYVRDLSEAAPDIDHIVDGAVMRMSQDVGGHRSAVQLHDLVAKLVREVYRDGPPKLARVPRARALAIGLGLLEEGYVGANAPGYGGALVDLARLEDGTRVVLHQLGALLKARFRTAIAHRARERLGAQSDWPVKCAMARQLLESYGPYLPDDLRHASPEQLARHVAELFGHVYDLPPCTGSQ